MLLLQSTLALIALGYTTVQALPSSYAHHLPYRSSHNRWHISQFSPALQPDSYASANGQAFVWRTYEYLSSDCNENKARGIRSSGTPQQCAPFSFHGVGNVPTKSIRFETNGTFVAKYFSSDSCNANDGKVFTSACVTLTGPSYFTVQ